MFERLSPTHVLMAVVVMLALALGLAPLATPALPDEAPPDSFSARRAISHVEVVAAETHPMGSSAIAEVRAYLVSQLEEMGLEPELQPVRAPDLFGTPGRTIDVVNVLARIRGTDSSGAILLMAHYDSVPTTPGANDNAAGVAAVLEAARALQSGEPMANDVIVLLTDGEEPYPRFGSPAFVDTHPWFSDVAFVMNFEALGMSGPSLLVQTGPGEAWTVEQLARGATRPVAFSFLTETVELMGELGTDFDPFLRAGTEGIHVAYVRGSSVYHTARDNIDSVPLESIQHHGDYALALTRHLGQLDLATEADQASTTFFTVLPGVLVHYGSDFAVPIAAISLAAAVVALVLGVRRTGRRWAPLLRAGYVVLGAAIAATVATLAWMGIVALRADMGLGEAYLYLAMTALIGLAIRGVIARRMSKPAADAGAVLLLAILGLVLAVVLPGASYLFAWPVLVASLAMVLGGSGHEVRLLKLAAVATATAVILVPAIDTFFSMSQPRPGNPGSELTEAFGLVVLLFVLAVELLLPFLRVPADELGLVEEASMPDEVSELAAAPAA